MSMGSTTIARGLASAIKAAAPKNAYSGEWAQTIEQAGVSSGKGGFSDRLGTNLRSADDGLLFATIREAVEKLYLAGDRSWNVACIGWRSGDLAATIDTIFDPEIVPRASNDPVFEEAATARRTFWDGIGKAEAGYLGAPAKANNYGQTRWLSSHRRLLKVELGGHTALVSDGLSTPWPGVADKTNGSGLEIFLQSSDAHSSVEPWIDIMLSIGDMIADDVGIESDVVANGAILYFDLPNVVAPYSYAVLSIPSDDEPREIPSLPYGSARVLKVTAVTLSDLAGQSLDGWAVEAAHQALIRRREANAAL